MGVETGAKVSLFSNHIHRSSSGVYLMARSSGLIKDNDIHGHQVAGVSVFPRRLRVGIVLPH